ncbi:hypothetical protein VCSRO78_2970 [Vibrio cholerae]|nr:hypothetical protein DA89_1238 [Vibrio paracholerae]KFE08647.1 hypothetical protein DN36_2367 [Vibrio cholerae]KFE15843.1 hypothetical protein DN38_2231 [Vibrio cholerae]SYZ83316.1 Uncharacterised protein [Vibrio paracholerae]GHZ19417.1 hypothetical protein VCSRO78_2970 [Vibrio cholerae]
MSIVQSVIGAYDDSRIRRKVLALAHSNDHSVMELRTKWLLLTRY